MALSKYVVLGDGDTRIFTLPLDYIDKADVSLRINNIPNGFSFLTPSTVQVNGTPTDGAELVFSRITQIATPDVTYIDGANLTDEQLNTGLKQCLFGLQELTDNFNAWVTAIQGDTIVGSDLPPVPDGDSDSFIVSEGGAWVVKTLPDVQAILGIADIVGGADGSVEGLPEAGGFPGLLSITTDGDVKWLGIKGTRDLLNLGNLALHNDTDYGSALNFDVGTDIGELPHVVDVGGGVAGLPALDGSLLTNIGRAKYIRVDERAAFDTNAGTYTVANTWVQRQITSAITDETGDTTITSGHLNVKAGTYETRIRTKMRVPGFANVRLVTESGATIFVGMGVTIDAEEQCVEVHGKFTLADDDGLRIEILSTGTWSDSRALGTAHNTSALGSNIYTIFELWKLP